MLIVHREYRFLLRFIQLESNYYVHPWENLFLENNKSLFLTCQYVYNFLNTRLYDKKFWEIHYEREGREEHFRDLFIVPRQIVYSNGGKRREGQWSVVKTSSKLHAKLCHYVDGRAVFSTKSNLLRAAVIIHLARHTQWRLSQFLKTPTSIFATSNSLFALRVFTLRD